MRTTDDNWAEGSAYDAYMGRWSRTVATAFVQWLEPAPRLRWLDIGCGTGALATTVLQNTDPEFVIGCDPSPSFVAYAAAQHSDPRLSFQVASLANLPHHSGGFCGVVSGLVLNFISDPIAAVRSMMQRGRPGGLVAAYVWDYAGRMDFLRLFWETAVALDTAAVSLDEGRRFPLCQPSQLESTFQQAGLSKVRTTALDIPTHFNTYSDYWGPFLAGTGPAPKYVASLEESKRNELEANLKHRLDPDGSGAIKMIARAWAVSGEME